MEFNDCQRISNRYFDDLICNLNGFGIGTIIALLIVVATTIYCIKSVAEPFKSGTTRKDLGGNPTNPDAPPTFSDKMASIALAIMIWCIFAGPFVFAVFY